MKIQPQAIENIKGNERCRITIFLSISRNFKRRAVVGVVCTLFLTNGHNKCSTESVTSVNVRGSTEVGNNAASVPNALVHNSTVETELAEVSFEGGEWTAETHLAEYGFNVDWVLLKVLESSCRNIESLHIPEGENNWEQYTHTGHLYPLNEWCKAPNNNYVNCKLL